MSAVPISARKSEKCCEMHVVIVKKLIKYYTSFIITLVSGGGTNCNTNFPTSFSRLFQPALLNYKRATLSPQLACETVRNSHFDKNALNFFSPKERACAYTLQIWRWPPVLEDNATEHRTRPEHSMLAQSANCTRSVTEGGEKGSGNRHICLVCKCDGARWCAYMLVGEAGDMGLSIKDVAGSTESQILNIFVGVLLTMCFMCSAT